MPESQARLEKIAAYVKARLEQVGGERQEPPSSIEYRWRHTLRVANIGKEIAVAEGADVEQSVAACLLHDVATFDPGEARDHGRRGGQIIRPFLQELGYPPEAVENICYAVSAHVDGKGDFDHPTTLEARVTTDADNVDRFGPYRLIEDRIQKMGDYEVLIESIRQRLPRLEYYRDNRVMETDTGQVLFKRQVELQIAVFQAMLDQYALSFMPRV